MDFVNIVNYIFYMNKKITNNNENSLQVTNLQEHKDHQSKGIYLRDDHCDWGSSGINELTDQSISKD